MKQGLIISSLATPLQVTVTTPRAAVAEVVIHMEIPMTLTARRTRVEHMAEILTTPTAPATREVTVVTLATLMAPGAPRQEVMAEILMTLTVLQRREATVKTLTHMALATRTHMAQGILPLDHQAMAEITTTPMTQIGKVTLQLVKSWRRQGICSVATV